MNLHIQDKLTLVDLATIGSKARRYVKPDVLIAESRNTPFIKGDMLDANATYNLIREMMYGINTGEGISDEVIQYIKEQIDTISSQLSDIQDKVEQKTKSVLITQSDYDALQTYEANTIYFIVESINDKWTFGKQFPITFGSNWEFGNTFPLNLK